MKKNILLVLFISIFLFHLTSCSELFNSLLNNDNDENDNDENNNDENDEEMGLEYALSDDETYYIVTGIGFLTFEESISIPSTYKGLPVTEIAESGLIEADHYLKCVTIPNSIKKINDSAFYSCSNLKTVIFEENSQLTTIGASAFEGTAIEFIEIPNSVISIGEFAFRECNSLETVTFESDSQLEKIDMYAFYKSNLNSITIPNTVTAIEAYAFNECTNLDTVIFEEGIELKYISKDLFSFSGLKEINIPNSIEQINEGAFEFCESLEKVTFEENSQLTDIGECAFGSTLVEQIIVPKTVTNLGALAFSNCKNLKSVTFEDGIQISEIKEATFNDCSSLIEMIIPRTITFIGENAFFNCSKLEYIYIPSSVNNIISNAFSYCNSFNNIEVEETNEYYMDVEGVLFTKNGETLMKYASKNSNGIYEVPEGVNYIESLAFYGAKDLVTVVLPDSLSYVGNEVFSNCVNLENINIPLSLDVAYKMFENCYNLQNVTFEDSDSFMDYSISSYSFYNCYSLKHIVLGEGLWKINDYSFYNCTSLETIEIPSNTITVGSKAFINCTSIIEFIVSEENKNMSSIDGVLYGKNLTLLTKYTIAKNADSYYINENVEIIGDYAFEGSKHLNKIYIPGSVYYISTDAFKGCYSLRYVFYHGTEEMWNEIDIYDEYITNKNIYFYSETPPETQGNYWHYDIDGVTIIPWS